MKIRFIWSISTLIVAALTLGWLAMAMVDLKPEQLNPLGVLMAVAFRFLSSTDVPLIQLLIGCVVGRLFSAAKKWVPEPSLAAAASPNV